VATDLESAGYAFGAADLPAAGVGAPHRRQRLWFVAHAVQPRSQGRSGQAEEAMSIASVSGADGRLEHADGQKRTLYLREWRPRQALPATGGRGPLGGFWCDAEWLPCLDGKARPVEPGTFPLAHGVPARVGRLRAYGNAIVPEVAATFIRAYLDRRGVDSEAPNAVD
jgi:DNA (cytosine-5)-methyltransferase 1